MAVRESTQADPELAVATVLPKDLSWPGRKQICGLCTNPPSSCPPVISDKRRSPHNCCSLRPGTRRWSRIFRISMGVPRRQAYAAAFRNTNISPRTGVGWREDFVRHLRWGNRRFGWCRCGCLGSVEIVLSRRKTFGRGGSLRFATIGCSLVYVTLRYSAMTVIVLITSLQCNPAVGK